MEKCGILYIGMAKKKTTFKDKIISAVSQKFGDRFKIEGKPYSKVLPNIILSYKIYNDPIFSMFILEPNDNVLEKLDEWKGYITNPRNSEKFYILTPVDKNDEVSKMSSLVSDNIIIAQYSINENGKVQDVIYG